MKENRPVTCIVCPKGCRIDVELEDGRIGSITGFSCKRGEQYAREECTAPKRALTTTMRITGAAHPLLPVRSRASVPKELLFDMVRAINSVRAEAPVRIGDVVLENALGTGVDIIASRSMERAEPNKKQTTE